MKPTNDFRFLEKEGERILQQKWEFENPDAIASRKRLNWPTFEWQAIPLVSEIEGREIYGKSAFQQNWEKVEETMVEEIRKEERKRVFDEILETIRNCGGKLYTSFDFMRIIYEVKNRQQKEK